MSRLSERITTWSKVGDLNTRQTLYQIKDVIRLLEDALAALRPGLSNVPDAGDTINNFFGSGNPQLNDHWFFWAPLNVQQPESQRSAGIRWHVSGVSPDRMEFDAGTTTRYYLSDYLHTAVGGSMGFSEAKYTFNETQSYATNPTAATWRGLDVAGTVAISAESSSGTSVAAILNTTLDSWSGGYTPYWANNTGNCGEQTPGRSGGSCIYFDYIGDGNICSVVTNHITGSDFAVSITAPFDLNSAATMAKDRTWVLKFDLINYGPATGKFNVGLLACSTPTVSFPLNSTFSGLTAPTITTDSSPTQSFDVSATQTWSTGADQAILLDSIPADTTWRTYSITFTTSGMAGSVGDPFYPRVLLENAIINSSHCYMAIDNVSVTSGSNVAINTALTERAFTLDQFVFSPTVPGEGDAITMAEATGAYLVPRMAPSIASGGTATVSAAYGAVTGFALSGSATGLTVADAFGLYAKVPGFGTVAHNVGLEDESGSYFTAFRTGTQAASIRYRLPLAGPTTSGQVLAADTAGLMSWANASSIPSPSATQPIFYEVDSGTDELWLLGVGAAGSPSVGPVGPMGPQGPAGPPGVDGEDGQAGADGASIPGPPGAAGASGAPGGPGLDGQDGEDGQPGQAGPQGIQGIQGPAGMPGLDGEDGMDGMPGPPGLAGAAGATGATGAQGIQGPPGMDGEAGEEGCMGPPSAVGPQGPAGVMGPPGYDGEDGFEGTPGPAGPAGATGATGSAGAAGATGAPGPPGWDGADGDDGPAVPGPAGATGQDGRAGATGATGATGASGAMGAPGQDGEDGVDGRPGQAGAVGPQGPAGPPGWDGGDADCSCSTGVPTGMFAPYGALTGSGVTGYFAQWQSDGSLSDSQLFGDTIHLQVSNLNLDLTNTDNTARKLQFFEPSGSGSNVTSFKAQAQALDANYALPSARPSGILKYLTATDADPSVMSWDVIKAAGTANVLVQYAGDGNSLGVSQIQCDSATTPTEYRIGSAITSFYPQTTTQNLGKFATQWQILYGKSVSGGSGSTFIIKTESGTLGTDLPRMTFNYGATNADISLSNVNYFDFGQSTIYARSIGYTMPSAAPGTGAVLVAATGGTTPTLAWSQGGSGMGGPPGLDGSDCECGGLIGIPSSFQQAASGIGGSGTANKVAKWSAATTLTNSSIWDDGTNVNIFQTGSTDGALAVKGAIATENPGAAFKIYPGGGNSFSLTADGGLTASRSEAVPTAAPTVNGAVKTCTTAGQQSWTSVLPVANGGTGSSMGPQPPMWMPLDGECDCLPMLGQTWPIFGVSGIDVSLPNGTMESEVAISSDSGFKLSTKSNTGVQTVRLQISSGKTAANTILNFFNAAQTNFNSSSCGGLTGVNPQNGGASDVGTINLPWRNVYGVNFVGGDDLNGTDFTIKAADGSGTPVTVMTIPQTASPQAATWAPDMLFTRKLTKYNNVATAGWGVPAVYAAGRFTAQTAAKATVATYTVGASDGSFEVSANVNVTTATTHNFTVTCIYTDEGSTSRTLTLGFTQLSGGTFLTAITNVTGAGPYESPVYHIRCKASTSITIGTTGTFTTVTYNVEGIIKQTA